MPILRALSLLLAVAACAGHAAWAADLSSPVGEWRTIDDATGLPRALVRIVERDGTLIGIVDKPLMKTPTRTNCDDCTDDRRGKPIIGMEIIRGLRKDGDHWDGGTVLDPEHGTVYRCTLSLRDGGTKLALRGYIGLSLFGRTQVWDRVE